MKKTLIAAIVLGAASTYAMAESSVTLYGNIDGGVTVSKAKNRSTKVQMTGGNWASNSVGLRGVEDLGNGNSVFFRLEQGFNINNGSTSANWTDRQGKEVDGAFNRQATLGFQGDWGQFAFGRFGGLTSDTGTYSILGGSAYGTNFQPVGSLAGAFIIAPRVNNGLVYVSPNFGGVNLYAAYSNGTNGDEKQWSKNNHYYGLGVTYNSGAFQSNLSWEGYDNKGARVDGVPGESRTARKLSNVVTLGASYDFGTFTLYGAYQYANHVTSLFPTASDKDLSSLYKDGTKIKGAEQNAFSVSLSAPLGGGTAYLQSQFAFGKLDQKGDMLNQASDKYRIWSVGAAYTYPLSKRTLVYAGAAYGQSGKALNTAEGRKLDLTGWNGTVGVSHSF